MLKKVEKKCACMYIKLQRKSVSGGESLAAILSYRYSLRNHNEVLSKHFHIVLVSKIYQIPQVLDTEMVIVAQNANFESFVKVTYIQAIQFC